MSDKAKTQQHERDVFQEFLLRASLNIDHTSVQSREPPEPDIWCSGPPGDQYVELGKLLDQGMQKLKLRALENAAAGRGVVSMSDYNVKLPEREMLKRKIKKAKGYETKGLPVDLLLYFNNTDMIDGDVPSAIDPATHYLHVMNPLVEAQTNFRRVYVFDRHQGAVLYRYPQY